ncbi:MAG: hypothetical protein K0U29_08620 [Gammaproteobacteria bacterium]|nr:hypothetical protein [Gammaproteobacteria bacterium]MCH9744975.1 hypothetical protein [Gammaproteobacteria bacterium]
MPIRFYAPKYWLTWLGIFLFYCFCKLPYSVAVHVSGWLGYHILKGSRKEKVIQKNIQLCFPELDLADQEAIVEKTMWSFGMSLYEMGLAWWASDHRFFSRTEIRGVEHYKNAAAQNKGVLVLAQHFYPLEVAGRLFSRVARFSIMQQIVKNELFGEFRKKKTIRFNDSFPVSARAMFKMIKQKRSIVYFPDLNHKQEKGHVFAPFFEIPAATTSATSVFLKRSDMPVVPVTIYREQGQYILEFMPAIENFPTGDATQDAAVINKVIEELVRQHPDQYMWHLKRFKTRPMGEPDLYNI